MLRILYHVHLLAPSPHLFELVVQGLLATEVVQELLVLVVGSVEVFGQGVELGDQVFVLFLHVRDVRVLLLLCYDLVLRILNLKKSREREMSFDIFILSFQQDQQQCHRAKCPRPLRCRGRART